MSHKLRYNIGTAQDTAKQKMVSLKINLLDSTASLSIPDKISFGSPFSITIFPKNGYVPTLFLALMVDGKLDVKENNDNNVTISTKEVTGPITIVVTSIPEKLASVKMSIAASNQFINDNPGYLTQGTYLWAYQIGLNLLGMLETVEYYSNTDIYETYRLDRFIQYALQYYEDLIDDKGIITDKTSNYRYSSSDYNSDNVLPGYTLLKLMEMNDKAGENLDFYGAIFALSDLLNQLPRLVEPTTVEGTAGHPYLHKAIYAFLHWLDGQFMTLPFRAKLALKSYDNFDDIVTQMLNAGDLTYDSETQLYRHGFAGLGSSAGWNDVNGQAYFSWGRALGWYIMAMLEVLEVLPEDNSYRDELITLFSNLMSSLLNYRDEQTGVWRLLPAEDSYIVNGVEKNIFEATSSCMYAFGFLRGVRKGYLPESMLATAKKIYEDIVNYFVTRNKDIVTLRNCVTGGNPGRDCTTREEVLQNYYSKSIADNDPHGMGPFIRASVEYEKLFESDL